MKSYERFLNYVRFDTTSNPNSNTTPSSSSQFLLAEYIKEEMVKIGIKNVVLTDKCYLYGEIPSNVNKQIPTIGFIAHLDTSPDCSGKDINPIIHKNYDGNDIVLDKDKKQIIKVSEFPFLKKKIGHDIITTDGSTLLGADDKAGVAEILSMAEYIIKNNIKHGTIKIAFTPDEEIGRGADFFDVKLFDAEYAYTVDGGEIEYVNYENFNAASCNVIVKGRNIHPGSAKDKMLNSINIAYEFDSLLPSSQRPQFTEMYEGFNHLNDINGNVEETKMHYIIRNHDLIKYNNQKQDFINAMNLLNNKYGINTVLVNIKDSYFNMANQLQDKMFIVDRALNAIKKQGFTPTCLPIRGGTDGALLTFKGLPCPNLGTGGFNFHGKFELISINDMDNMTNILIQIVKDLL